MIIETTDLEFIEDFTGTKGFVGPGVWWLTNEDKTIVTGNHLIFPKVLSSHIHAKKGHRGQKAIDFGKECVSWFFENTGIIKIQGMTPINLKHAYYAALKIGFRYEGTMKKAWEHNGELIDLLLTGITKEGWYAN